MPSSRSTWARAAISGTTPPKRACSSSCEWTILDRIVPLPSPRRSTTAAAVSSQVVSIPSTRTGLLLSGLLLSGLLLSGLLLSGLLLSALLLSGLSLSALSLSGLSLSTVSPCATLQSSVCLPGGSIPGAHGAIGKSVKHGHPRHPSAARK